MVEGRQSDAWEHTASLLATLENLFKDADAKRTQPHDRHPFHQGDRPGPGASGRDRTGDRVAIDASNIELLKAAWCA
jgi:hypothetical protein